MVHSRGNESNLVNPIYDEALKGVKIMTVLTDAQIEKRSRPYRRVY